MSTLETPARDPRRRVAVVGSGVAGLTAAYVLGRGGNGAAGAHVTLFEADDRLGGHADTHEVDGLAIDTGFIVHNERTYPVLLRLFAELGRRDAGVGDVDVHLRRRHGAGVGGRAGPPRGLPDARPPHRPALPADARGDPPLPPQGQGPARRRCRLVDRAGRDHAARVPARGRLHGVLHPPLHGARGRGRVVVRPGRRARLPRALPVHLPRAPRHARRLRLTCLAHRHRRVPRVRAPPGRAPRRRPHRHQGHLRPRDGPRRRGDRRERRGHDVRRRRRRHPPRPDPGPARRAHADAARGPRRDAVLPQHRAAPHRHLAAAADPQHVGVVELPTPRDGHARAGDGHLRPHPAPTPRHRHPLPGHPGRRAPRRPGRRDRPDGVRAPALQPRLGRRAGPPPRDRHRPDRLRGRLPRLGLPRGRRALRPPGRRAPGCVGRTRDRTRSGAPPRRGWAGTRERRGAKRWMAQRVAGRSDGPGGPPRPTGRPSSTR